jgi:4-alpha-glucanotransferase
MGDRRIGASAGATLAVLEALGADVRGGDPRAILKREEEAVWQHPLEPVVVAWEGRLPPVTLRLPSGAARRTLDLTISLDGGGTLNGSISPSQRTLVQEKKIGRSKFVEATFAFEEQLPHGYHELHISGDGVDASCTIFSAPLECYPGETRRTWGVFAPLYAMRTHRDKPVGDLSELERLLAWVSQNGGGIAATLPISAAFLTTPFDPSPYSPASRLYWNELFADLDRLLANSDCVPARNRACAGEWQFGMRTAARGDYVDYREVAQLKRHVMEALADWFFLQQRDHSAAFRKFISLYPDAVQYAQFRAAGERQGRGWPAWPPRMRGRELESHDFDDEAMRYHLYAQFVMHEQLEALAQHSKAEKTALYLDMPLGVHPDSFDVWSMPDLFVTGASAGAPPDSFFTRGQNWGFPPLNPKALRNQRYEYLRRVLRTQLRYAGMLRIDHVMSLHRLFFVPSGYEATDGVYVRYPEEQMYAVLTIESQRHKSAFVGEDLGTVPPEVRKSMKRHGVKRMFVVQFEANSDDPPIGTPPAEAVASLNTHDMPPFAAYWDALDADLRQEMGLLNSDEVQQQRKARDDLARSVGGFLRREGALESGRIERMLNRKLDPGEALAGLLDWLARSPADITLVNLEDLWLEERPQNVPGTSQEKPNWRRRMRYTLGDITASGQLAAGLERMNAARRVENKRSK